MADIAQARTRLDLPDAPPHGFVTGRRQSPAEYGGGAHEVHPAGVSVKAVADDRDVDIDDVAALQLLVPGDAVADHMVHGSTDCLRKPPIVEIGWNRLQLIDNVVV